MIQSVTLSGAKNKRGRGASKLESIGISIFDLCISNSCCNDVLNASKKACYEYAVKPKD